MNTSIHSPPEDREPETAPPLVFTKVEILRVERCDDGDYEDAASPPLDPKEPDWRASQASLASSEVSAHRESWRDIVSPTEVEPKPERWKDSQVSLASSEVSGRQGREGVDERWSDTLTSPPSSDVSVARDARERWSDCRSPPDPEVTDPAVAQEPSEVYYTASSEVSLLSDTEVPDKAMDEEKKECVIAGHVAAMRERFESMTRANTPCPDLGRSSSPSLDVFRNITPSPDRLG